MPSQAVEVILQYNNEPMRLLTTHLETFAAGQRAALVGYLADRYQESVQRLNNPTPADGNE